jgi:hypothetical protein
MRAVCLFATSLNRDWITARRRLDGNITLGISHLGAMLAGDDNSRQRQKSLDI